VSARDPKEILYGEIDKAGREKMKMDLVADTRNSRQYISRILAGCLAELGRKDSSSAGDLLEAFLHFLITSLSFPSERKVRSRDQEVDIVIPSIKSLQQEPSKALVIQVIRADSDISSKLHKVSKVQPETQNLWAVSLAPLGGDNPNYSVLPGARDFSEIMVDIQSFLSEKGVKGLRMVSG